MGYAFISYSTKNQSLADAMRNLLKECGIETWMAPGDIPPGNRYAQVINRAIKDCDCFILMLSEEAQNSIWVAKEVERAVNYRKPIIPVQIDKVVLNDEFELYISTDHLVAIQKIDKETNEIKNLLTSISNFVTKNENGVNAVKKSDSKSIELTVWSPVNTDVFLNDKKHMVMRIDHNTGYDYSFNTINISGEFELVFASRGFEKRISFDSKSIDKRLEYRLQAILSKKEIYDSYDRDEAIAQLKIEPTAYSFEQLAATGTIEDINLLKTILSNLISHPFGNEQHNNYLLATCAKAMGNLMLKYNCFEDLDFILDVYKNYEAKSSYGYLLESVIKSLKKRSGCNGSLPSNERRIKQKTDVTGNALNNTQGTLFIGIGGMGCRTVKIIKENEKSNKDFLADYIVVDTDTSYYNRMINEDIFSPQQLFCLFDESCRSISQIEGPWTEDWLDKKLIPVTTKCIDGLGAMCCRQIGRMLLCGTPKYEELESIIQEKASSLQEKANNGKVNIVIVSGLYGGTGGGTFLDITEMARNVAGHLQSRYNPKFNVICIIYDPRTMEANIPAQQRMLMKSNGYAALSEMAYFWDCKDGDLESARHYSFRLPNNREISKSDFGYCDLDYYFVSPIGREPTHLTIDRIADELIKTIDHIVIESCELPSIETIIDWKNSYDNYLLSVQSEHAFLDKRWNNIIPELIEGEV